MTCCKDCSAPSNLLVWLRPRGRAPPDRPTDAKGKRPQHRQKPRYCGGSVVCLYNHDHRHSGIRYVTPAQRHAGWDYRLLKARHAVYQSARERNPRRWSGTTRNWTPVSIVTLNPERDAYVQAAGSQIKLSGSIGEPAFPSRPGDAKPRSTTEEMGGAEPPVATRSASHCASMARMASTAPSPQ